MEKEFRTTLYGYKVSGDAVLNLWGGGQGEIRMQAQLLPAKHLSKDNVLRCVNDNGFGCESIDSAHVRVTEVWRREDGGGFIMGKTVSFESLHPDNQHLYNGWRYFNENSIGVFDWNK